MVLILLLGTAVLFFVILIILFFLFFRRLLYNFNYITGYIIDIKVDEIFRKATIIAEQYAQEQQLSDDQKIEKAIERATAIAADVLLINKLNPRDWNLIGLVNYHRHLLRLKTK